MNALAVQREKRGTEESLGAAEPFSANDDVPAVRHLVAPLIFVLKRCVELTLADNVTHTFFDVVYGVEVLSGGKVISALVQHTVQVLSQIVAADVHALDSVRNRETFIDLHGVRNAVSGVQYHTG